MRTNWSALYQSLHRSLNRTSSDKAFQLLRQDHPVLHVYASIPDLLKYLHRSGDNPAGRYQAIRLLVEAAQDGEVTRPTAITLVILALWPGLDAVFWRLWRGFPAVRDDLPSEMLARLGEAILVLDLQRITAVTATLLRNLERDIRRNLIAEGRIAMIARPIDDPVVEAQMTILTWSGNREAQPLHDYLHDLSPRDLRLLQRVFLLGETQEEAGRALGLKPDAARKRVQRALQKLRSRQNSPATLSHSGPPIGL